MQSEEYLIPFAEISIGRQVGIGKFAEVFEGTWKSNTVAIKVLKSKEETGSVRYKNPPLNLHDSNSPSIQRAQTESSLLGILPPHDNVVKLYGTSFNEEGHVLVISEFIPNGNLWEHVSKGPIDDKLKYKYLIDVAKGMSHLHRYSVIHRDLAARNILIDAKNNAKICDFGLARITSDNAYRSTATKNLPLRALAPESLRDQVYSKETDVWSFATLYWEVMTGTKPFPEIKSSYEVAIKVRDEGLIITPPTKSTLMKYLIQSCQHPDPKKRPTFEEIKMALEEYYYSSYIQRETIRELKLTSSSEPSPLAQLPKEAPWLKDWNHISDLAKIGSGRFHSVFKGTIGGQTVAVMRPFNIEQFAKEVSILGEFDPNPYVLGFMGACCDPAVDKELAILVEYMPLGTLRNVLENSENAISLIDKLRMSKDVAVALQYCHNIMKIIHRDLHAAHVMVYKSSSGYGCKLSDFHSSIKADSITDLSAKLIGSKRWKAIESLIENKYSTKSDIWALGMTMIEIVTRKLPLYKMTDEQVAQLITSQKFLKFNIEQCPSQLNTLINNCLESEPLKRPNCSEIIKLLNELDKETSLNPFYT